MADAGVGGVLHAVLHGDARSGGAPADDGAGIAVADAARGGDGPVEQAALNRQGGLVGMAHDAARNDHVVLCERGDGRRHAAVGDCVARADDAGGDAGGVAPAADGARHVEVADGRALDVGEGGRATARGGERSGDGVTAAVEHALEAAVAGAHGGLGGDIARQPKCAGDMLAGGNAVRQRLPVGGVPDEVRVGGRPRAVPRKRSLHDDGEEREKEDGFLAHLLWCVDDGTAICASQAFQIHGECAKISIFFEKRGRSREKTYLLSGKWRNNREKGKVEILNLSGFPPFIA